MPLEHRRSFVVATLVASLVVTLCCFAIVRDTINAASIPVQLAFSVLVVTSFVGMFQLLRTLLPLGLVRAWPALDR